MTCWSEGRFALDDCMKLDSSTQTLSRHSQCSSLPTLLQYNAIHISPGARNPASYAGFTSPANHVDLWLNKLLKANLKIELLILFSDSPFLSVVSQVNNHRLFEASGWLKRHSATGAGRRWGGSKLIKRLQTVKWAREKEQFNFGLSASTLRSHYLS